MGEIKRVSSTVKYIIEIYDNDHRKGLDVLFDTIDNAVEIKDYKFIDNIKDELLDQSADITLLIGVVAITNGSKCINNHAFINKIRNRASQGSFNTQFEIEEMLAGLA